MKKIWIILSVIAAIVIGVIIYLKSTKLTDFEPQIKEKLAKLVLDGSKGLYHLDMDTLLVDVVGSNIKLVNAHLKPDTVVYSQMVKAQQAPNDLFEVTIDQLAIEDVSPTAFFTNKVINLRRIFINKPVVRIIHKKQPFNKAGSSETKSVYQQIKNDISSIRLDTVIFQNVDVTYINKDRNDSETKLSNVKIFFNDILIDSTTETDTTRFLYARNCAINVQNYHFETPDGLYLLKLGDLEVQTTLKAVTIKDFQFTPRVSRSAFYKEVKVEKDIFNISVKKILLQRVSWWEMLAEETLKIGNLALSDADVKVYRDKAQPVDKKSKLGKFPHQMLMKVPIPVLVDSIQLKNFDIEYTETNPKSGLEGVVVFQNTNGLVTHASNMPEEISRKPRMNITATTRFMRQTPLSVDLGFDLAHAKEGRFDAKARVGAIGAATLNKLTVNMGLVQLNSLQIKSLDASLSGDNYRASGTVKMLYDDLNITVLKSADDTLKKRKLLSFVANSFIIKKSNPGNDDKVRIEKAAFTREINRSYFNLAWKTILNGAMKTVGYNKK